MGKKTIQNIIKKLQAKNVSESVLDVIRYELKGHGIPNAIENGNFYYSILKRKIKIRYYFEMPGNFCMNEWCDLVLSLEEDD